METKNAQRDAISNQITNTKNTKYAYTLRVLTLKMCQSFLIY